MADSGTKRNHADMSIGARLGDEATRREISHAEAAEIIGISQATFSRWVNGDNLPTSPYFTKLARFLRIPRDEVVRTISDAKGTDPVDERMSTLEEIVDRLEAKLDLVLQALDLNAAPGRRRGR
jgi:transcriptional regulator with XRE-family HTH domain